MSLRRLDVIVALLAWLSCAATGPPRLQAVATDPDYPARARQIVTALATRQFDTVFALFNATRSAALSPSRIAGGWDQVLAQRGSFQRIESVQVVDRTYHVATVTCVFDRGPGDVVIYLDDRGLIAGLNYPPATAAGPPWAAPSYADPSAFHEEPVTVVDGPWQLPATLTLPNGRGPFPAVVLVSGSGPNDADETVGPNKTFKDLAWGLASKGIAVLRYPKRTRQYPESADAPTFTVKDEYVDDARAAVALLASRAEINPRRVFVAGHSEGGYVAPRIATSDAQIAGLIILAGTSRPMEQAVLDQFHYLATLPGADTAALAHSLTDLKAQAEAIAAPDLQVGSRVRFLTTTVPASYFLDLRGYDPTAIAARLPIPIYVVQGGRDYNVPSADFANWQRALASRANATLKVYPSLDHLLMPGTGPSTPAQFLTSGRHASEELMADLAAWIASR